MNVPMPPTPSELGDEVDGAFAEAHALLDRISDMCIGAFVLVLVVLAVWGIITLLGRRGR